MKLIKLGAISFSVFILGMYLTACGGSSSDSEMIIEGTLTEAGGADHPRSVILRHSDGQLIEDVQICALGECSTTDGAGQFGFVVGENFSGGEVLFTFDGHGIQSTSVVNIPEGANEVILDFQHVEGGAVEAQHITIDGETQHNEDEEHQHE